LLFLGLGIAVDVARKGVYGSEPIGEIMMAFSFLSLIVNVSVLRMLKPFREGEVHLRATWIFTKVDVIANLVVFTSGAIVWTTNQRMVDLVVGGLIALYVIRESIQILSQAIAVKPCAP
jgi:Co/Zn/Cd efflux system component